MTVKRFVALLALVGALIVAGASPAFAHATLLTTEPQPGGRFESSPPAVSLRFDEPVEVTLGGIRLFDGNSNRIDIGAPHHPQGSGNQVQSSLPKLDDGTYVVTWRVTSADSLPPTQCSAARGEVAPGATITAEAFATAPIALMPRLASESAAVAARRNACSEPRPTRASTPKRPSASA